MAEVEMKDSAPPVAEIDESLYSRQLYVLGHEAMKRMGASNVLIVGLKGLGVEIAKNIALAGVKSLTVYDPEEAKIADLSSQFFLRQEDVGKPRDIVTAPRLAELNTYVPVNILESRGPLEDAANLDKLKQFQVVVFTNTSILQQRIIGDFCHKNGVYVVFANTFGLFGSIFCDFGDKFVVNDVTGEAALTGIVVNIDETGLVSSLDETRHGLEDGDYVTFTEIEGMEALNNAEPRTITTKGPYNFSIGDVTGLGEYKKCGLWHQVKMPKTVEFKSYSEALADPEYLIADFAKFDHPDALHTGFQALSKFHEEKGRLPEPFNEEDAQAVISYAKEISKNPDGLKIDLVKELSYQALGDLSPMAAFLGGIAAQEVLKAVSGKFHPIKQWLYFDSIESLPTNVTRNAETCKPTGTRYDGQIVVFGKEFQKKLTNTKEFLVGAGAIGCEMLKNWAMIGLGTGPEGKLWITDMDSIERSNLNRQFLFRAHDVGNMKSDSAAKAVQLMNPELNGHIKSHRDSVGKDTEHIFNEEFWNNLDGITNALDNVDARRYVDGRCVFFRKHLLESGTLGTKGNTQVVLPNITESYASSHDPPEQGFPMCTVRSFPYRIEHTIAWAKNHIFEATFVERPQNVNKYLTQSNYVENALKEGTNQIATLKSIHDSLTVDRPRTFEDCIAWARLFFEKLFVNDIQQLLYTFPKDSLTSTGAPFWSAPKRAPDALKFDVNNSTHLNFVIAGANLHAFNYDIKVPEVDREFYVKELENVIVPDFSPDANIKIQANENEADPNANAFADEDEAAKVAASLPPAASLSGFQLIPVEFEKDDDTNFHIDFITACSNLRALNYKIEPIDRHQTKFIAGKIIPAIATTTALVTGLVVLELYKIIGEQNDIEKYKNGFVNLALPFFGFSEPIASPKVEYQSKDGKVTLDKIWDRFEVEDITLQELLDHFEAKGLSISMLSSGVSLLYASFQQSSKLQEKLPMKLSQLVEFISKTPIPEHQNEVLIEMVAEDTSEEDVDVPFITVKRR